MARSDPNKFSSEHCINPQDTLHSSTISQFSFLDSPHLQSVQHKNGTAPMHSSPMLLCSSEHAQKVFLVCKMQPSQWLEFVCTRDRRSGIWRTNDQSQSSSIIWMTYLYERVYWSKVFGPPVHGLLVLILQQVNYSVKVLVFQSINK